MKFIIKKVIAFTFKVPKMHRSILIIISIITISLNTSAQNKNPADTAQYLTLDQCITYALQNQPALMQSLINVTIAKKTNAINLSAWLPQVDLTGSYTNYFELPTGFQTNSEGTLVPVKTGLYYNATPALSATETLFNPDVLYAASSAHLYVKQAEQATDSSKIGVIASVSKAFYNLLLTLEQINVLKSDTAQLARNLKDTYHQYVGGIVDKTDYEEATISLNNGLAQLKQAQENVHPQYATLKQLMGFEPERQFNVSYDTAQMMQEIAFDTTQQLKYENRIEYQQIQTAKELQNKLVNYYRLDWLPNLSVFYDYNYEFESNTFSQLFTQAYPNSLIGIGIDIPVFTGFKRLESVQKAKLQEQQIDWGVVSLKSNIYTQYATAMANYKSNLYSLHFNQENVKLGKDVYSIVSLQYKQGIVPYLNVITAQTDWITSEINYLNALFEVLSSKIDLEQSMGLISPNR
jgi:outer membrane protein TolC